MQLPILRSLLFIDETLPNERDSGDPLRKVAVVGIVRNPLADQHGDDLTDMIAASAELGRFLSQHAVAAMAPYEVCSYGKGGIVGLDGKQEHINALVTSTFAAPLREAIGGAAAWISSFTKRAAPGSSIDVPLAHKDALYVRSHYDGMTITVPDGPQADEIAVIICVANRGRIDDRVGGLRADQIEGKDGLR
ncbi:MAG: amino acid synthesis family protein [Methylocella sp.]